jgi:hypothetical protein
MKSINDQALKDMLQKDYIARNSQLSVLMGFINSLEGSTVVAIDSPWGTGKTIFVKQLEILNQDAEYEAPSLIDDAVLQRFRERNDVYYFNAWESDFIDDPLQALIYGIITDLSADRAQERAFKKAISAVDLPALVKNISKDGIDLSKLTSQDAAISEIKAVIDRKKHVHNLLEKYLTESDKKLVFIIDELDRCKPSFAVNLLEVVKHYFGDRDIIFIIATDNSQLVHTICRYYGVNFNGASYLNKFFDFNIRLTQPDKEKYIAGYLGMRNDSTWKRIIPADITNVLDMSMREIESYFKSLELVSGYTSREHVWNDNATTRFCQWIFVPLALALKISHPKEFEAFVSGKDDTVLRKLSMESRNVLHLAERYAENRQDFDNSSAAELVASSYASLFKSTGDHDMDEVRKTFQEITNLISSHTTIRETDEGVDDD